MIQAVASPADVAWQRWQLAHKDPATPEIAKDAFLCGFEQGGNAAVLEMYEADARARQQTNEKETELPI